MGRERSRTGKHLYLFIAGMIFMSVSGCAMLKEMVAKDQARTYLVTAQKLLAQGDYEESLKINQRVLSLSGNVPPADEALFNMGLIHAHYGYAGRDYQKSLAHFKKLVQVFPQSPFAEHAKIWICILQDNERLGTEIEAANESIRKSRQEIERLRKDIEELTKAMQEHEKLKKEVEELTKTIEKSKQVDIEIDEKKKEILK